MVSMTPTGGADSCSTLGRAPGRSGVRSGGRYGRDGCRVPVPWIAHAPAYGFSPTGAAWLPQPDNWAEFARDAQLGRADSTLGLYRDALRLRRDYALAIGRLKIDEHSDGEVLRLRNGSVAIVTNFSYSVIALPVDATVLASSAPLADGGLPCDTTVWMDLSD